MSSQNPTNAKYSTLSLGEPIRAKSAYLLSEIIITNHKNFFLPTFQTISRLPPSHPGKIIAKITTAFIGVLVVSATILVALSGTTPSSHLAAPSHKALATQEEPIHLENDSQNRYVEFQYDPISGKYSHVNKNGSRINPFVVKNVERHSEKPYDAYLHKKDKNEEGSIYWKFNLKSTEKILEKLEIRMVSINNIADGGGKAEACLQPSEVCKDIPVGGVLIFEKPESETLTVGIKLFKDIQLFGRDEKCTECGKFERGFTVKAFWKSLYLAEKITTQNKLIQFNPNSGDNYVKFTYSILNNTYSHDNIDGSPVAPYFVDKIERLVDRTNNEVYLRQEFPGVFSNMYWAFNLTNDGKLVEKVVISIPGIEELTNNRAGVVEACENIHEV
nr:hypothetical protein C04E12.4 - Caenorhabditis elegans [Caenorhabditis elegans]